MSVLDKPIVHRPAAPPLEAAQIAGRLERLPMTNYQRRIFAIIATAWLVDQVDVALLAFLLGTVSVEFGLTPMQAGLLASMTFAGQLVGNVGAGLAADRYGRRSVFRVTMLIWGFASFLAAGAWSAMVLMGCRFLIGVGVGGEAPVAQAMVSELVPASVRGRYIAFMEGFWAVGYVLSGAISYFALPHLGWRWVFVIVGSLSFVVLLVRRGVPESPRWLSTKGRFEEAERVVAKMEAEVQRRLDYPLAAPVPVVGPVAQGEQSSPLATIFSRHYATRTIMAFGLWFFALIGFFGLNSWLAVLLKGHGFSIIGSVGFVTLITTGGIPGFFTAAWSLERIGRKPTTVLFLLASAVSAYVYGQSSGQTGLFVSGFIMQFFMFGMWSCLYAYTPELYPTWARATGAGLASAAGRVGAILGPILVPILVRDHGQLAAFEVGAIGFALAAALVLLFGIETRQLPLEQASA
jgi:putative MFS transporter